MYFNRDRKKEERRNSEIETKRPMEGGKSGRKARRDL